MYILWVPSSPFSFILCANVIGKSMLSWHVVTCFALTQKTVLRFLNYNILSPLCLQSLLRNAKDEELHLTVVTHLENVGSRRTIFANIITRLQSGIDLLHNMMKAPILQFGLYFVYIRCVW